MGETFPHYYEDGCIVGNFASVGWKEIHYGGIYRDTCGFPYQWNRLVKRKKPIALFVTSMWRGDKVDNKKCWYGCDLVYKFSVS